MRPIAKVKNSSQIQTRIWNDHLVLLIVHNTPVLHRYIRFFMAFTIDLTFHGIQRLSHEVLLASFMVKLPVDKSRLTSVYIREKPRGRVEKRFKRAPRP